MPTHQTTMWSEVNRSFTLLMETASEGNRSLSHSTTGHVRMWNPLISIWIMQACINNYIPACLPRLRTSWTRHGETVWESCCLACFVCCELSLRVFCLSRFRHAVENFGELSHESPVESDRLAQMKKRRSKHVHGLPLISLSAINDGVTHDVREFRPAQHTANIPPHDLAGGRMASAEVERPGNKRPWLAERRDTPVCNYTRKAKRCLETSWTVEQRQSAYRNLARDYTAISAQGPTASVLNAQKDV